MGTQNWGKRARADPAGERVCVVRACAGAGAGNQQFYSTSLTATTKTIALGVCVCSLPWMLSKKEEVFARVCVLQSRQKHAYTDVSSSVREAGGGILHFQHLKGID